MCVCVCECLQITKHTIYSACQTFPYLPSTCFFFYCFLLCNPCCAHSVCLSMEIHSQINFHLRVCLPSLNLSINITQNLCTFICTSWKSSHSSERAAQAKANSPARISMLWFCFISHCKPIITYDLIKPPYTHLPRPTCANGRFTVCRASDMP